MPYNLYDYSIRISYNEEDNDYFSSIDEFRGCTAFGDTPFEALKELKIAFEDWLAVTIEKGYPIPEPFKKKRYSCQIMVKMPRSLHDQLSEKAKMKNVSLNQEILTRIALGLGTPLNIGDNILNQRTQ